MESAKELNINDNKVLDKIELKTEQKKKGIAKAIIFTTIAVIIFFIPLTIDGRTDIAFGFIYKFIVATLGDVGAWIISGGIVGGNAILSIYGKFLCKNKENKIYKYYEEDSVFHVILYVCGAVFSIMYLLSTTLGVELPEVIVGSHTAGSVIPVALDVSWIIPVSAVFMPFLLNYGIVDFMGSLMEPLMRPVFRVPGRSAVNAIASFVSSSSVGVLITSKLYKEGVYTKREAAVIATGFSAVSVGFAYMVIETAGLSHKFIPIYFSAMLITLIVSFFMTRIPPLSKIDSVFLTGEKQDEKKIKAEAKMQKGILTNGANRAIKKAALAPNLGREIGSSLKDGYFVLPKVVSLLTAVGIIAMIIATQTDVFNYIGMLFEPLLNVLGVPDAELIAPSFPVGIAEMFLPVLLIQDKIDIISEAARYMVVTVSMVQIIFFSETVVVMLSTKIPVNLKQLIICFIERTIIAIPIAAVVMHIMF